MTVGQIYKNMSSSEFAEWVALANIEYEEKKRNILEQRLGR